MTHLSPVLAKLVATATKRPVSSSTSSLTSVGVDLRLITRKLTPLFPTRDTRPCLLSPPPDFATLIIHTKVWLLSCYNI